MLKAKTQIWWKAAKFFKKIGGKRQNEEINLVGNFIITDKYKISPIEVKSSGYKTHKSLDQFCAKYSERIMNRYLIYTKDYKRENGVAIKE